MESKSITANSSDAKPSTETSNLDDFHKNGFRTFVEATRASNDLPKGRDFDFYKTHASFTSALNGESSRLLQLMNRVLNANAIDGNIKASSTLSMKEELVGEANDAILDRALTAIDELNGLRSIPAEPVIQTVSAEIPNINGSWNRNNVYKLTVNSNCDETKHLNNNRSINLMTAKNIIRPQTYFKDKIENGNQYPWKPRLTEKPNSLKPLALYLEPSEKDEQFEEYSHPYEFELEHFNVPDEFLAKVNVPRVVKAVEKTPLFEIETESQLDQLVDELRKHKEIAVDLEHHSYRSFQGITCLMQISTKDADYLIDTLTLRHKLYILNEVFTKPTIVKIFHGAECDIQWLQRDLSLYVVNMFDTHKASRTLGYSGLSLAYLLNRFCSFMPNKKFQLADWRIRPLPQELKDYAREDTHYLIYVYEMLKNELYKHANGDDNLVKSVFQQSTDVCKMKYVKPRWTPTAHLNLYSRRKKMFDNRQLYALKEIFKWRDSIAREEDESTGYVLPNHMMFQISEMLPREVQGILACCNPIPPLVRANSLELHQILLKAREQPLEKAIMQETNRRIVSKELVKVNIDSPLHCPHDSTKQDFKNNLPTLLDSLTLQKKENNENLLPLEKPNASCRLFNDSVKRKLAYKNVTNLKFLGPFDRYKLIKPYLQAEADKEKEIANQKNEDDPSVVDRIAALHEHFVQVQQTVQQSGMTATNTEETRQDSPFARQLSPPLMIKSDEVEDQPLINMPGSRKRKRESYHDRDKPKEDEFEHEEEPRSSKRLQRSKHKDRSHQDDKPYQTRQQHNRASKKPQQQEKQQENFRGKKGNFRGKGKWKGKPEQQHQQQKETVPYDYSKVDFSQFSGGGRSVGSKKFDSKHKGKGQNKRGQGGGRGGQGRSMTFSYAPRNVSGGSGGRGGGGGRSSRGGGGRGRNAGSGGGRGRGR